MVWAVIAFVLLVGYFLGWATVLFGAPNRDDAAIRRRERFVSAMERDR